MSDLAYQGLIGLSQAMYLWLISAGLTIIFGVLGVLNFAHGSLFMLGAYVAYTAYGLWGLPFVAAVALSLAVVAALGLVMERGFLRHLYDLDHAYQLLLTFGFVLVLDDAVKLIWGGVFKIPSIPRFLDATFPAFGRPFPVYNVFIMAIGVLVAVGLWLVFERTWWGRMVRATAADREMAAAIGIETPRVYAGVFMLGAALAALGGALGVPVRPASPGIGVAMIVEAFVITVIGGLGNLAGAFVGSLLIGVLSAYGTLLFPVFELFFVFVIMAAVLLVRPQGLFARS
ncbi:MAG: branched-chain amino acid ABC transporter permease [Armatimonadota bacterium]|nr:branched-chain amino acid ABC transporter permease [Armatimonadota bacterium]MDR7485753.1 branched-chain amino acid ABC transporter permease [Armatimonadota bacterium]MDR7537568.1 branched-chain amino acid ABC transporter permease [Armatimonadota bacterium]